MHETAAQFKDILQSRLDANIKALKALDIVVGDVPNDVRMLREVESQKLRAVIQEQSDMIQIISIVFPKPIKAKPAARTPRKKDKDAQK